MTRSIIAFAGFQGSGKDYRCNELVQTQGYTKLAFATALRRITFTALGYTYEYGMEHYEELKQTELINGMTLRNIMEKLGTEGIRHYDNDFWVRCLIHDIEELPEDANVCISDLRFYNEYDGIKQYCDEKGYEFKLIFCDFHSERYDNKNTHASAKLASFLSGIGYKDGAEVADKYMQIYINSLTNTGYVLS